eukprot:scaffold2760_cov167-Amphora_coffeaeformis.AAC.4
MQRLKNQEAALKALELIAANDTKVSMQFSISMENIAKANAKAIESIAKANIKGHEKIAEVQKHNMTTIIDCIAQVGGVSANANDSGFVPSSDIHGFVPSGGIPVAQFMENIAKPRAEITPLLIVGTHSHKVVVVNVTNPTNSATRHEECGTAGERSMMKRKRP